MNSYKALLFLAGVAAVYAYPDGAPAGTCTNGLVPSGHDVEAQNSPSPYELKIDYDAYPVELKLHSKEDGKTFKGFLIHALKDGKFVGDFEIPAGSLDLAQHVKCNDDFPKAAVTHKDASDKKELTVFYYAPEGTDPKSIKFPYTVVEEKVKFWINA